MVMMGAVVVVGNDDSSIPALPIPAILLLPLVLLLDDSNAAV